MSEPAIPSLFQVHGTSLGQDHISDRITNVNSHSILYYTEVVVCGLVFNRISVRFLMALVQWCSGYVSFLSLRERMWLCD